MRDSQSSGLETLLVGIDAGCHNVLGPFVEAGETPTLESLMADGVDGVLES